MCMLVREDQQGWVNPLKREICDKNFFRSF